MTDVWCYVDYFSSEIQYKEISEEYIFIDGIRLDRFKNRLYASFDDIQNLLQSFLSDKQSIALQTDMQVKYKVYVNLNSLYYLAIYVKEIINSRIVALLNPTMRDMVQEIGIYENIDVIEFKLRDGNSCETDQSKLKKIIYSLLKIDKNSEYEIKEFVSATNVYTNEYSQVEFVKYMSEFFHKYFLIKRRVNSYLTTTEQNIICWLLRCLELSPVVVSNSRFRQLFNCRYSKLSYKMPLHIPGIINIKGSYSLDILPYGLWKNGKINPLKINGKLLDLGNEITYTLSDRCSVLPLFDAIEDQYEEINNYVIDD